MIEEATGTAVSSSESASRDTAHITRGGGGARVGRGTTLGRVNEYTTPKRLAAEFLGTFWLVFGGCGSAVLAAGFAPTVGDRLPRRLAGVRPDRADDGLRRGSHLRRPLQPRGHRRAGARPALRWRDVAPYVVAQVVAAIVAAAVLCVIAYGAGRLQRAWTPASPRTATATSPRAATACCAVLVIEVVLTAFFLYVILGATDTRAPQGFAPLAIGLALTLIHLVSIPVDNTSVNPARSTGPALFAGSRARWRSCGCSGWLRSSAPRSPDSATRRCSVGNNSPAHWKRPARRSSAPEPDPVPCVLLTNLARAPPTGSSRP